MTEIFPLYLELLRSQTVEFAGFGLVFALVGMFFLGPRTAIAQARANVPETLLNVAWFVARVTVLWIVIVLPIVWAQGLFGSTALGAWCAPAWAAMPLWIQVLVLTLMIDGGTYWRHRILHMRPFWPIHAVHHSDTFVQWHTGQRFHPIESAAAGIVDFALPYLLGAPAPALAAAIVARQVWGYLLHTRLPWTFGPLQYLVASPVQHQWHHVKEGDGLDKNFATMWSIWDVIFGTYYVPSLDVPPQGISDAGFPSTVRGQVLWPFIAWLDGAKPADSDK